MTNTIGTFAILVITTIFVFLFSGIVIAQLSCQAVTSCSGTGNVELIKMSAESNAHGALPTKSSYSYSLCCSGIQGLKAGTGDLTQDIMRLSGESNAHAESPGETNYNYAVKLAIDNNPQVIGFRCEYLEGGCDDTYPDCIITLSDQTNAHLAECGHTDAYTQAICCMVDIDTTNPTITDDYAHDGTWVNIEHDITLDPQDELDGSGIGEVKYCWDQGVGPKCGNGVCDVGESFGNCCQDCSCLGPGDCWCDLGEPCDVSQGISLVSPWTILISGDIDDTLRYQAWDNAGNPSEEIGNISVKVDNTPPVTNCVNCPSGQIGNGRNIDLNPTDSTSDVDYTKYCVIEKPASCDPANGQLYDEQQKISVGFGCPIPDTCEYELKYFSMDIAENQEAVKSANIVVNRTLPWCSLDSLPTYTTNNQISLQWDGDDPGGDPLDKFEIQFKRRDTPNDEWELWSSVGSFQPTVKSTTFDASQHGGDGEYEFKCVLSTTTGEQSEPDLTSTILDTREPSVSFNLPQWSNQENFSISWTASDGLSGLDFTIIFVNSNQWRQVSGTTTSQDYQGQSGKSYDIKLEVHDKAGNSKQTGELTITVDTDPPSCSISPLGEFTNKKEFNISWSSPDQDVDSYDICINSDGSECSQPNLNWGDLTVTSKEFTGTQGNKYYFRCRAIDKAGNTGDWSSSVSTTIDAEPPELDEKFTREVIAGDVLEDLEVNATVTDDFGIKDVVLILGEDEIDPKSKTGTSGDNIWTLKWEIPYSTYGSYNGFTITVTDINNNVDIDEFNYSILDCQPGQIRSCDPRDPSTDKLYDKGVCRHSGNRTCRSDGQWGNCTGGTLPSEEDCNDLDDDCDGKTDEDLERKECGFNNIGICRLGLRDCVNGDWGDCVGAKLPADEEVCGNGWDDDCNGFTDDGCVDVCTDGDTQPCGHSDTGICKLGYQICSGAMWDDTCHNVVYPETELCDDDDDNDCDGYTDCDDTDCIGTSVCDVIDGNGPEPFPWWILSIIGVIVLVALAILWLIFRRKGEELTWDTLKKKWESPDWF
jgi:hypothetical protein